MAMQSTISEAGGECRHLRLSMVVCLLVCLVVLSCIGCLEANPSGQPIRIAVLPILDSLPLYVAESEGFFRDEGIAVELIPASSAAERDQLFQADQVDLLITDLVALALANRDAGTLTGVRYAMVPTADYPQFRILAAPGSEVRKPGELRGLDIAVSEGTVIQYVTERLLSSEGLATADVQVIAVPRIPDRMALLAMGDVPAATLPEPLGSLAMAQGARLIIDDTHHPQYSCSIYAASDKILTTQPESIRALLRAVDRAIQAINADKAQWANLLIDEGVIPPTLTANYALPDYPTSAVPSEAQVDDVVTWLIASERLEKSVAYEALVSAAYLD